MIELITTILVISILLMVILPAVQRARMTARGLECKNRLRQIGVGLANAHQARGEFPSDRSCLVELLPFLEKSAEYEQFHSYPEIQSPVIELYSCPLETFSVHTNADGSIRQTPSYRVNLGVRFPQVNDQGNRTLIFDFGVSFA